MDYRNHILAIVGVLMVAAGNVALAETREETVKPDQQARLEAQHKVALEQARTERLAAEASVQKAREHLQAVTEERSREAEQNAAELAARDVDLKKIHEELSHARRQLNQTSREIARVNREVARERARGKSSSPVFPTSERPVIGVILGAVNDVGVEVIGVSPDGPSERAGVQQGDVIIAIGGRALSAVDDSGDASSGLRFVMQDIRANQPIIVSVERGSETLDLSVVPEIREPLTLHSVMRFGSAPDAPGSVMALGRIVVPDIDTRALTEQIEKMRLDIEERKFEMARRFGAMADADFEFEFDIHELSELGDLALQDANIWFGLPMTRGLRLAEMDEGLASYFKTDRGVLVLKARDDNDLQLKSGDVILQVEDTEVNSPAEFMRALRDFESGQKLTVNIKRDRKNKSIKVTMPEHRTSFSAPHDSGQHRMRISINPD